MTKIFENPRDLLGADGLQIGPTDWITIEQDRINSFADATNDHQWIHVDIERARSGPFGATIAHGYLTMSLASYFLEQMIDVRGYAHGVNVGMDRVRFLNPVKVGARIRARGEIASVEEKGGGIQSTIRVTIETEGEEKPACVLDTISRYFPE